MSKTLHIGDVGLFDEPRADKEQALKVLEEAAEAFAAWQEYDRCRPDRFTGRVMLLMECADVIQAVANLAGALGVDDLRPHMAACERRNRERGRIS